MKLSVIIPAHNESASLSTLLPRLAETLSREGIDAELIVVNDNSRDDTQALLQELSQRYPQIRVVQRTRDPGFGRALRAGLEGMRGDCTVFVMGDGSDDPEDVVRMFRKIEAGVDVVYGSRFIPGAERLSYPPFKLFVNRLANHCIRVLFGLRENDITNAFKMYHRRVIEAVGPIQSEHFDITAELPLKAARLGFSRATIPVRWYGRESGVSKMSILRMSRHYLQTVCEVWLGYWPVSRRSRSAQSSWQHAPIWGWLVWLLPLLVYWRFPNQYWSSTDPIMFAEAIGSGNWKELLNNPNHLFYNLIGRMVFVMAQRFGIRVSVMALLQWLNAIWGAMGIALFWSVCRALVGPKLSAARATLFAWLLAFSYGYWFFSIENEVYVPPIVLALSVFRCLLWLTKTQRASGLRWAWGLGLWTALMIGFYQSYGVWGALICLWAFATVSPQRRLVWLAWYCGVTAVATAAIFGIAGWLTVPPDQRSFANIFVWSLGYLHFGGWGSIDFGAMRLWPMGFVRVVLAGRPMRDWVLSPQWTPSSIGLLAAWAATAVLASVLAAQAIRQIRVVWRRAGLWVVILAVWTLAFAALALWVEPIDWQFWVPVMVPLCLLAALLWNGGAARARWETAVPCALVLLLGATNWTTGIHPDSSPTKNPWYQLASELHQQGAKQQDLVLMYEGVSKMYEYYYGAKIQQASLGLYLLSTGRNRDAIFARVNQTIHETLRHGGRVFIAESELHPNPKRRLPFEVVGPEDYAAFYKPYEPQMEPAFSFSFEGGKRWMYRLSQHVEE